MHRASDGPNAASLPRPNIFLLKLTDGSEQAQSTLVSSISDDKSSEMGEPGVDLCGAEDIVEKG